MYLNLGQVAEKLGISKERATALIDSGQLPSLSSSQRALNGGRKYRRVSEDAVRAYQKALRTIEIPVPVISPPPPVVSSPSIIHRRKRSPFPTPEGWMTPSEASSSTGRSPLNADVHELYALWGLEKMKVGHRSFFRKKQDQPTLFDTPVVPLKEPIKAPIQYPNIATATTGISNRLTELEARSVVHSAELQALQEYAKQISERVEALITAFGGI